MRSIFRGLAVIAMVSFTSNTPASSPTFVIDQIYSSADGVVQFAVLREAGGANGQNALGGRTLTVTQASVGKTYAFPNDLASSSTAGRSVLIVSQGYVGLRIAEPAANMPAPDYVVPDRFFPTDTAAIDYAGVNRFTYASLPADGITALYRGGARATNKPVNFDGTSGRVPLVPNTAIEYYNVGRDHYFVSSLAPDIEALDSGRLSGWVRTGETFKVLSTGVRSVGGADFGAVCRFYVPPEHGDSHFISASAAECATILKLTATDPNYSGYVHETPNAFYGALPNTMTGACARGTVPVYRLWNRRADSNHRYTTSPVTSAQMVARGYLAEGYGPNAVALCVSP